MLGRIHSFESFGTVDGPGIRYVIFLQGCPLRCQYCHNPDTWEIGAGKEYTAEQVVAQALRYRNYFGEQGGVTVTGGEPLVQIDFIIELFTLLKEKGMLVYLRAKKQTLLSRLQGGEGRPLLEGKGLEEKLTKLLNERESVYEDAADEVVDVDGKTPEEIATEILGRIKK